MRKNGPEARYFRPAWACGLGGATLPSAAGGRKIFLKNETTRTRSACRIGEMVGATDVLDESTLDRGTLWKDEKCAHAEAVLASMEVA